MIDTLRILPAAPEDGVEEPALGVEVGGLQSAEGLLISRYFMYSQVYFHRVRISYDIHLMDFMRSWLRNGHYPIDLSEHMNLTDSHVLTGVQHAAANGGQAGHDAARRILERRQFRALWERNPADLLKNRQAGKLVFEAAKKRFGEEHLRHRSGRDSGGNIVFPVLARDGKVGSSISMSEALSKLPSAVYEYVLVSPEVRRDAERWLAGERDELIKVQEEK